MPELLTTDLPSSADLVIVGGGIVGAATAFFAARAGLRTVVIEKRPALATLTTPASTGAFRLQFDNPDEIALVREGVELFERFAEHTDLPGYDLSLRRQGYLFVTTTEAGAARQREWVGQQRGWGLGDVEIVSGDEARYRWPYLTPAAIQARYRAGDGWLDPRRLALGYARASRTSSVRQPAAFVVDTPVTGFTGAGDRITGVTTSRGTIACEQAIIAAGPFSGRVAALAGLPIDLRPVTRYKLILPDVPEVPASAPMTIEEETAAHWRPWASGAFALYTAPNARPTEPLDDVMPSAAFAFGLLDPASPWSIARISPFWRKVWERQDTYWVVQAGQYEYTPDHRPYLGATPIVGLHLNTGYSGHGIMASAGGSRLVVDLLLSRTSPAHNPFRWDRPFVERSLDIL